MKLFIKIEKDSPLLEEFFYNYIPKYMATLFLKVADRKRLLQIDSEYQINSTKLLYYSLLNQFKSKSGNMYTIGVNKNLKYKGQFIMELIHKITYGDLTHKGYPVLLQIFKEVSERINIIYEEWLEKWQ